ncbi:MAG: hypothetical protein A3K13_03150 [Gemmatimonadetes bacterium RIFCSPLOWO2_12_FULL_68_9]|nr:MAG: hypothetical protein A3K13_03150 [Gemmatimonadetes bacterium RIFCSPLOWO2_12_FULL_68_9]
MSWRLSAVGVVLLAAFTGCRSVPEITGTYDLVAVNGARLPVRAGRMAQGSSELTGGSVALNPDGTYRQRLLFRVQTQARAEYADSAVTVGTYERRMSTVRLHAPGGDMSAQLAGPLLTVSLGGWTYAFRKAGP